VGRIAVALSLLALPLCAGCGGSKSSSSSTSATTAPGAYETVQAAAQKTVQAGSEHVVIRANASSGSHKVTLSGTGDFDSQNRQGTFAADASIAGLQASLEEVLDGTTAYVRSPLLTVLLPAGKSWLKIDLATAGQALGIDTAVLRAQDPAVALAQLQALQNVRKVGTVTVNGVTWTHYRGSLDAAKLPKASADALTASGSSLGPADVWVGDDGYVHRLRLTTRTTTSGGAASTVVAETLSQFGKSVQVSVPPGSETVDASKVTIPGLGG
jgi:hypothetical protein